MCDENIIQTNNSVVDDDFIFNSWDDEKLNLSITVLRGIYAYGFEKPSPIQKQAILSMFDKKDIMVKRVQTLEIY